jgi:uncharacterized protein (DUF1778 family)
MGREYTMTAAALPADNDQLRRGVTINLRATAQLRDLIDRAARVLGKSRSEFMLDSARRSAEDVLLDQRVFILDDAKFAEFVNILEQPPKSIDNLKKLLSAKAPWEK